MYIPVSEEIKIIDFGGATYDNDHHSSVINTRQYRAPEVILGCCEWDHSSDLWSIGCILMELISGELYFPTHENYEHLAMIEKSSGRIPQWMGQRAENGLDKNFSNQKNKQGSYFDWPKASSSSESEKRVKGMKIVKDLIQNDQPELVDLINKCLEIDPKNRITCK